MKLKIDWKKLGRQLCEAVKPVLLAAIGGGMLGARASAARADHGSGGLRRPGDRVGFPHVAERGASRRRHERRLAGESRDYGRADFVAKTGAAVRGWELMSPEFCRARFPPCGGRLALGWTMPLRGEASRWAALAVGSLFVSNVDNLPRSYPR